MFAFVFLPLLVQGPYAEFARLDHWATPRFASSFCPDGCRFDRTAKGDIRYQWVDGPEPVLF